MLYEQDANADTTVDTTVTYTFDANDRLTIEVLDTTGTEDDRYSVYTYDATQQIGKTVTEGTTSGGDAVSSVVNEYNLQGRMSKVTTTADGVVTETEYEYSDAGLRVKQTITVDSGTPVVTEHLFDNGSGGGGHTGYAQVVEEFIDDVLAKVYTLGHDVIGEHHTSAVATGAQTLLHLHDGHGSTRMLLNDLVELVQRFAYDAYGNHLSGAGLTSAASALTSLLYSGEFFDKSINQQYLRARWYDATTGRFNRLDPFAGNMRDPQSLHKYAYVHGDPVNAWDPSGLAAEFSVTSLLTTSLIGGVLGALGGGAIGFAYGLAKHRTIKAAVLYAVMGAVTGFAFGAAAGAATYTLAYGMALLGTGTSTAAQMANASYVIWTPTPMLSGLGLGHAIKHGDSVDIAFASLGFAMSAFGPVLPSPFAIARRIIPAQWLNTISYREVWMRKGGTNHEFDEVSVLGVKELKTAEGNPYTGWTDQQAETFATSHIYNKTKNKLNWLYSDDALTASVEPTVSPLGDAPSISELRSLAKNYHFDIKGDNPILKAAVNQQISQLQAEFPDVNFSVRYGVSSAGQ